MLLRQIPRSMYSVIRSMSYNSGPLQLPTGAGRRPLDDNISMSRLD